MSSFNTTIDSISKNEIVVNCSDVINKGKKQANSIGYLCTVDINKSTVFKDISDNPLTLEDFSSGNLIRIVLSTPQPISEKNRRFEVAEIILIKDKVIE
ncbi:hypothetical protein [Paenibacillus albiflavus]|uniref:hypothetical protein n=1 Tax=Paenibacillus albiflavus TaxID=2545760 RepID=UPI001048B3F8|nr:hypothetical protein [Paenibacillus albiflavus]